MAPCLHRRHLRRLPLAVHKKLHCGAANLQLPSRSHRTAAGCKRSIQPYSLAADPVSVAARQPKIARWASFRLSSRWPSSPATAAECFRKERHNPSAPQPRRLARTTWIDQPAALRLPRAASALSETGLPCVAGRSEPRAHQERRSNRAVVERRAPRDIRQIWPQKGHRHPEP